MPNTPPIIGGCIRSLEDKRDFRILCGISRLPKSVDLRSLCSPVENQRHLNSCTANACVGAMEMLEKKQNIKQLDLSRLYVYYNTRLLDNSINKDAGAYMGSAMKAIRQNGACLESMWPYDPSKVFNKPTQKCYSDGARRQSVEYARVNQGYSVRTALAEGFPVVFGMMLTESFNHVAGKTGIAPMPKKNAALLGGHAMLIVGYDINKKMYLVRNSWGKRWGKKGYCYIPFAMIDNPKMSWDFWVVRSIEDPENTYKIHRPNKS